MFHLLHRSRPRLPKRDLPGSDSFVRFSLQGSALLIQPLPPALRAHECEVILHQVEVSLGRHAAGQRRCVLDLRTVRSLTALAVGLFRRTAALARGRGLEPCLYGLRSPLLDQLCTLGLGGEFRVVRSRDDLKTLLAA